MPQTRKGTISPNSTFTHSSRAWVFADLEVRDMFICAPPSDQSLGPIAGATIICKTSNDTGRTSDGDMVAFTPLVPILQLMGLD